MIEAIDVDLHDPKTRIIDICPCGTTACRSRPSADGMGRILAARPVIHTTPHIVTPTIPAYAAMTQCIYFRNRRFGGFDAFNNGDLLSRLGIITQQNLHIMK